MNETKFSTEIPDIFYKLQEKFGVKWDKLVIAYENTIYCNTNKENLPNHLIIHEETHLRQQKDIGGAEIWYKKYINDPKFRLEQEIEAFRNQVKYLKTHIQETTRDERREEISFMAETLSGLNYGYLVSYNEALRLINKV